jgi:hypothetical protein
MKTIDSLQELQSSWVAFARLLEKPDDKSRKTSEPESIRSTEKKEECFYLR